MRPEFRRWFLLIALLIRSSQAHAEVSVLAVALPEYGRTRALLELPPHPLGIVVLLPGGNGSVGVSNDGGVRNNRNFLVRTRNAWIANGYGYLLVDAPQDAPSLLGTRHTKEYAAVVAAVVKRVRKLGIPVLLMGTSQGSIAAASGAALLKTTVAGVVLTSTVAAMGSSGETVFDAALNQIAVPVLIVDDTEDRCPSSPPAASDRIAAALTASPLVEQEHFSSSASDGEECGPFSPHGYFRIEEAVVDRVGAWFRRRIPVPSNTPERPSRF